MMKGLNCLISLLHFRFRKIPVHPGTKSVFFKNPTFIMIATDKSNSYEKNNINIHLCLN